MRADGIRTMAPEGDSTMRLKWDLNPVVELPPLKVTTCMWVEMTKGCHGAPAPDQSWCSITSLGLGQVVLISVRECDGMFAEVER